MSRLHVPTYQSGRCVNWQLLSHSLVSEVISPKVVGTPVGKSLLRRFNNFSWVNEERLQWDVFNSYLPSTYWYRGDKFLCHVLDRKKVGKVVQLNIMHAHQKVQISYQQPFKYSHFIFLSLRHKHISYITALTNLGGLLAYRYADIVRSMRWSLL